GREARQRVEMPDAFEVFARVERLDRDAFRRVPDQRVGVAPHLLFGERAPLVALGVGHRKVPAYSTSRISSSAARLAPGSTATRLTVPRFSARSTFSIFIASTVASACPSCTSSPCLTAIAVTTPGIGHRSILEVSGGSLTGISRASSATRGERTCALTSMPRQRSRNAELT